jgi:hypothetical protein
MSSLVHLKQVESYEKYMSATGDGKARIGPSLSKNNSIMTGLEPSPVALAVLAISKLVRATGDEKNDGPCFKSLETKNSLNNSMFSSIRVYESRVKKNDFDFDDNDGNDDYDNDNIQGAEVTTNISARDVANEIKEKRLELVEMLDKKLHVS